MTIKVIIFDLGKVLFDYDLNIISKSFLPYAQKKEALKNINNFIKENDDFFSKYEKGQISSLDFYKGLSKIVDLDIDYEHFCDLWNNIFTPITEMISFIPILHKKYRLAILSNTNDLHYEFLKKLYPDCFKNFDDFFLSYKMNLKKPENEIYNKVIEDCNVQPQEIFFTDDLDVNVNAAKKCGINAFVFKNLERLKKDFVSVGIEI